MKRLSLLIVLIVVGLASYSQATQTVVAQDGTAKYKTVQEALDAIASNNKKPVTIFIKNGVYKEKLHLDSSKAYVTVAGEDKYNTVLTFDDHTGKVYPNGLAINTQNSASFVVKANNFTLENITVENSAGFTAGQAVGLEVQGDKAIIRNCRIIGNQDILFTSRDNSHQYYEDCYIEGTTDFIFGSATCWFERCHIHSKKNSHVTAASTPKEHTYGYIFNDCVLTGDTTSNKVSLGRPWRPYAAVVYIHCYIDKDIMPEGWANWNNTESYKTARYAEYKNYGPGANTSQRVQWSKQLSDDEAKQYTLKKVFGDWQPNNALLKR
jgi:pectinesterase